MIEEFTHDDVRYTTSFHYTLVHVTPETIPRDEDTGGIYDMVGVPIMWALINDLPVIWPRPQENIDMMWRGNEPYGFVFKT